MQNVLVYAQYFSHRGSIVDDYILLEMVSQETHRFSTTYF